MKKVIFSPLYETKINRAVFINQDIIVYPSGTSMPENIINVVKFLFGAGACVKQDSVNGSAALIIKGASYVLSGVKTLNADWTFKEIKQEDEND